MGKPIKNYKSGKIDGALWENDYQGKKNYSFSFQKSYLSKKDNKWEHTNFFTITDLMDLRSIIDFILHEKIAKAVNKQEKPVAKPSQKKDIVDDFVEEFTGEDIPF